MVSGGEDESASAPEASAASGPQRQTGPTADLLGSPFVWLLAPVGVHQTLLLSYS